MKNEKVKNTLPGPTFSFFILHFIFFIYLSSAITTLRFLALPAGVLLSATGSS
jgi:hypothetical protein